MPGPQAYTQDLNFTRLVMTHPLHFTPLTKEAVADSLGISKRTVENWVADGTIPAPTKLGNRVYWHPDVYYDWLSRRLKEAATPSEAVLAPSQPLPVPVAKEACRKAKTVSNAAGNLRANMERKLARLQG